MNRSITLLLTLFFVVTVIAGVLTPNEASEVEDNLLSYITEQIEVKSRAQSLFATTLDSTSQEISSELEEDSKGGLISEVLYPVVRVVDGDTIVIDKSGINESVRMIGIDTPETVHPSKPVQCFGKEASAKTKELLEGKSVKLITDEGEGERDKYGRLLGYVYSEDGKFINLELIKQGFAYEYTYKAPYIFQKEFMMAEKEAMIAKRGLWADSVCE